MEKTALMFFGLSALFATQAFAMDGEVFRGLPPGEIRIHTVSVINAETSESNKTVCTEQKLTGGIMGVGTPPPGPRPCSDVTEIDTKKTLKTVSQCDWGGGQTRKRTTEINYTGKNEITIHETVELPKYIRVSKTTKTHLGPCR